MADVDRIKDRVVQCATSCLDHVRVVKWGEAIAACNIQDDDQLLDIYVKISCYRRGEKAEKAEP